MDIDLAVADRRTQGRKPVHLLYEWEPSYGPGVLPHDFPGPPRPVRALLEQDLSGSKDYSRVLGTPPPRKRGRTTS